MATRRLHTRQMASRLLRIILALVLLYLALGLGFHFVWKTELAACRDARMARGEYVEPEVFWAPLAPTLDVTFWPVYAWANIRHDGTPFTSPCTH